MVEEQPINNNPFHLPSILSPAGYLTLFISTTFLPLFTVSLQTKDSPTDYSYGNCFTAEDKQYCPLVKENNPESLDVVVEFSNRFGDDLISNCFYKPGFKDACEERNFNSFLMTDKYFNQFNQKSKENKVRLEKLIKEIMAHPEDAEKSLVRQEKVWKDIA